jgi:hypothetical protein
MSMEDAVAASTTLGNQQDGVTPTVRRLVMGARLLMGLMFFVLGLNGFLDFMPKPANLPPAGAMAFFGAMVQTGYLFRLVKGTEVIVGALLLANRYVPLALALIAPVLVNIILFHGFLAPSGIGPGLVGLVLELYLAWSYRAVFRPMLAARVTLDTK